jgi:hypothetical protein
VIVFARQQHIRVEQRQQKPLILDDPLALDGENKVADESLRATRVSSISGAGVGPRQLAALERSISALPHTSRLNQSAHHKIALQARSMHAIQTPME